MGFIGSIISCAFCLAIIGVSIWLSIYYLGDRESLPDQLPDLPEDLSDYLPDIEIFHKEDPFNSAKQGDANRWPNDGSGLDLTLINALDSIWYDYFDLAVQEWDNGSPDSLTLSTETATAESECTTVDGVMKVCNGEYGETDWKGINTILMSSGWITTSAARMNDHFFATDGSDGDKRQYTMCHEIGHGFGLPHTDEEFWNRDLGNCLDYTNNFSGNKSPDSFLYNFLTDLYGSVDGSRAPNITTPIQNDNSTANQSPDNRQRRQMVRSITRSTKNYKSENMNERRLFSAVKDEGRRQKLLQQWDEINTSVINGFVPSERVRYRLLHKTPYGEAHEIELDDEYTVQIHTLYA